MSKDTDNFISNEKDALITVKNGQAIASMGSRYLTELDKRLNVRKFRVADTSLSYRQINHLDQTDVLEKSRTDTKGWRKFSYKELVYLGVIKELRKYGVKDEQLLNFRRLFFYKRGQYAHLTNLALGITLMGLKMHLVFDGENRPTFYDDPAFHLDKSKKRKSFISININEVLGEISERIGENRNSDYIDFSSMLIDAIGKKLLTDKEKKLMEIIRSADYRKVEIMKHDGEKYVIKAGRIRDLNDSEILSLVKEGSHHDIMIKTRDNKIQVIEKTDSFKI